MYNVKKEQEVKLNIKKGEGYEKNIIYYIIGMYDFFMQRQEYRRAAIKRGRDLSDVRDK